VYSSVRGFDHFQRCEHQQSNCLECPLNRTTHGYVKAMVEVTLCTIIVAYNGETDNSVPATSMTLTFYNAAQHFKSVCLGNNLINKTAQNHACYITGYAIKFSSLPHHLCGEEHGYRATCIHGSHPAQYLYGEHGKADSRGAWQ